MIYSQSSKSYAYFALASLAHLLLRSRKYSYSFGHCFAMILLKYKKPQLCKHIGASRIHVAFANNNLFSTSHPFRLLQAWRVFLL